MDSGDLSFCIVWIAVLIFIYSCVKHGREMESKCEHEWVEIHKEIFNSPFEVLLKYTSDIDISSLTSMDYKANPQAFYLSSVNIIMKCENCGEIKQFQHYNSTFGG